MAKYKRYDYSQSMLIPVFFEEQLMPGTLEFAIHTLVETRMDIAYLKLRSHRRVKKVFLVEKGDYKGQPISVRGIQKRMEYYAKKTGLKISCHHLRHTMATQLLNADAQVESIQDLLGHNWITTTERYCKVSNMKVKRDYFNAMARILKRSSRCSPISILDPGDGHRVKQA